MLKLSKRQDYFEGTRVIVKGDSLLYSAEADQSESTIITLLKCLIDFRSTTAVKYKGSPTEYVFDFLKSFNNLYIYFFLRKDEVFFQEKILSCLVAF